jgi:hypothetical protein
VKREALRTKGWQGQPEEVLLGCAPFTVHAPIPRAQQVRILPVASRHNTNIEDEKKPFGLCPQGFFSLAKYSVASRRGDLSRCWLDQ